MSYDLLIDRGGEDQTPLGSLDDLQRAIWWHNREYVDSPE